MQEEKPENKVEKKKMDDNVIFIGTKPFMNYVTAVVMQVTTRNHKEVKVIARGKFISKAVDVVEVAKNRFLEGKNKVTVTGIQIGSEKFTTMDERTKKDREISVSTIEITIAKQEG